MLLKTGDLKPQGFVHDKNVRLTALSLSNMPGATA